MELNLDKLSYDGKWFDFGNGRLKIRPYPTSEQNFVVKDGNIIFLGEQSLEKFKYCFEGWDNYVKKGTTDKIILDDVVKKKLYDFRVGKTMIGEKELSISDFVILKADEMMKETQAAEKN